MDVINIIKKLKKLGYPVYLMSNIGEESMENLIHKIPAVCKINSSTYSQELSLFNKVQCSLASLDYCSKPSTDYYKYFISTHLESEQKKAIFVDDKQSNINTVVALGYNGICFEDARQFERELNIMGVFKGHSDFVRMWEEKEGKKTVRREKKPKIEEELGFLVSSESGIDEDFRNVTGTPSETELNIDIK